MSIGELVLIARSQRKKASRGSKAVRPVFQTQVPLEAREIRDACTPSAPFRIPDRVGVIEFHQHLRISYRLLRRQGSNTVDDVLLPAIRAERSSRANNPISRVDIHQRIFSVTLIVQRNNYSRGINALEYAGEFTRRRGTTRIGSKRGHDGWYDDRLWMSGVV